MKKLRFSLAALMVAVAVIATFLAAVRSPSKAYASGLLAFTVCVLLCSTLAALLRRQSFWIGFALFGSVYLFLVRSEPYGHSAYWTYLPTTALLSRLFRYGLQADNSTGNYAIFQQGQALHFLFTLIIAVVGGVLAHWMSYRRSRSDA